MTSPTTSAGGAGGASLLSPLQPSTAQAVVDTFWGCSAQDVAEAYWRFHHEECRHALQNNGRHVQARSYQDILDITAALKCDRSLNEVRDLLRPKFKKRHQNELELIDRSIELAATLLLMINFGDIQYGFTGRQRLHWIDGTLRECVASGFNNTLRLSHEGIRLQRNFNALSLERIVGLEIVPTSNLLDHLRLMHDDKRLYIFHHASFLKVQSSESLLPHGLATETLNTLALLFPQSDAAIRKWYRRLPEPFSLDTFLVGCGHLKTDDRQLEKFTFWHDRLVVLKQVFDEAAPQTISQWYYDRRNSVQWYTFWVAISVFILTMLFGVIQSVTGIMQAYFAYRTSYPK